MIRDLRSNMCVVIPLQHQCFFTRALILPSTQASKSHLDEQRLVGGLHGPLGSLQLRLELGSLGPGPTQLADELLQLSLEDAVLGLRLVPLPLDVDQLVAGALQLSPGLVQLRLGLLELGAGLLKLVLALVQLGRQLVLSGAHGGGDFEQLTASLLQGLQLVTKTGQKVPLQSRRQNFAPVQKN